MMMMMKWPDNDQMAPTTSKMASKSTLGPISTHNPSPEPQPLHQALGQEHDALPPEP